LPCFAPELTLAAAQTYPPIRSDLRVAALKCLDAPSGSATQINPALLGFSDFLPELPQLPIFFGKTAGSFSRRRWAFFHGYALHPEFALCSFGQRWRRLQPEVRVKIDSPDKS